MMKKALLYTTENGVTTCNLCNHRCVIKPGRVGKCGVRENRQGELYSLVYGKVSAQQIDPVEKKPLFHFLPGTLTYSISTVGCNFSCLHCQNHQLSQTAAKNNSLPHLNKKPQSVIQEALDNDCRSISYTYVEPTVFFEYALDCCHGARDNGLKNIFVSNGYMSHEAAEILASVLDAINIDIKSFSESFYGDICGAPSGLEHVLENVRFFREQGVWVEVTTLVIPGLNDSPEELGAIAEYLAGVDPHIAWHVSGFRPSYKMLDRPSTPPGTLLRAREAGLASGLKHVYVGNLHSGNGEDTLCPTCHKTLIRRIGFRVVENLLVSGACPKCNTKTAGIW